jgi:hypothetical protein
VIVHGENSDTVILPAVTVRAPWNVAVDSRDDLRLEIKLSEIARTGDAACAEAGDLYLGASMERRDDNGKRDRLLIDGGVFPAPMIERFARTLLRVVEAAKAAHPEHWKPTTERVLEVDRGDIIGVLRE